jgi:hypothetical protein
MSSSTLIAVSQTSKPQFKALMWGSERDPPFAKALSALVSNVILGRDIFYILQVLTALQKFSLQGLVFKRCSGLAQPSLPTPHPWSARSGSWCALATLADCARIGYSEDVPDALAARILQGAEGDSVLTP